MAKKGTTTGTLIVIVKETGDKIRVTSSEYQANKDKYERPQGHHNGTKNPHSINITDEEILDLYCEFAKKIGFIPTYQMFRKYTTHKVPHIVKGTFRFKGIGIPLIHQLASERLSGMVTFFKPSLTKEEMETYTDGRTIDAHIRHKLKEQ